MEDLFDDLLGTLTGLIKDLGSAAGELASKPFDWLLGTYWGNMALASLALLLMLFFGIIGSFMERSNAFGKIGGSLLTVALVYGGTLVGFGYTINAEVLKPTVVIALVALVVVLGKVFSRGNSQ